MKMDWNTVEVLRHARHDWLNQIQLIKGYISLNNIDRVKEIIDEIVAESKNQSKLSNMKLPQFASLLLTCNWENHLFQIEFECIHTIEQKIDDDILTEWTIHFFHTLDSSIQMFHDNHLSVTIEPQIEGIGFFFDFSGIITNKEQIKQFLNNRESVALKTKIHAFTKEELSLEIFLPYN